MVNAPGCGPGKVSSILIGRPLNTSSLHGTNHNTPHHNATMDFPHSTDLNDRTSTTSYLQAVLHTTRRYVKNPHTAEKAIKDISRNYNFTAENWKTLNQILFEYLSLTPKDHPNYHAVTAHMRKTNRVLTRRTVTHKPETWFYKLAVFCGKEQAAQHTQPHTTQNRIQDAVDITSLTNRHSLAWWHLVES